MIESRPTCKVDKNELLGLVGRMRTRSPTIDPDAEPEVEVTTTSSDNAPPMIPMKPTSALPIEKRLVRTVARRRTPVVGMAPLDVERVATPPPALAAKPAAADGYVDLFAEGSEPSIDVAPGEASPAAAPIEAAIAAPVEAPIEAPNAAPLEAPIAAVADALVEMPPLENVPAAVVAAPDAIVAPDVIAAPSPAETPAPAQLAEAVREPDLAPVVARPVIAPVFDRMMLMKIAVIAALVIAILVIAIV